MDPVVHQTILAVDPRQLSQGNIDRGIPRPKSILLKPGDHHVFDRKMSFVKNLDLVQNRMFITSLIILGVVSCLNLSICVWIIKTLQLNSRGIGSGGLSFIKTGINVKVPTLIMGHLFSERLESESEPLVIQSPSETSSDPELLVKSSDSSSFMTIGSTGGNKIEIQSPHFIVKDSKSSVHEFGNRVDPETVNDVLNINRKENKQSGQQESILYEVTSDEMTTSEVNTLMTPLGGFSVQQTLEATSIHGSPHHDLNIESRRKSVRVISEDSLSFESKAGRGGITAFGEILLEAGNAIKFNSGKVSLHGMKLSRKESFIENKHSSHQKSLSSGKKKSKTRAEKSISTDKEDEDVKEEEGHDTQVLQVCSCESGRLFVSDTLSSCTASQSFCAVPSSLTDD